MPLTLPPRIPWLGQRLVLPALVVGLQAIAALYFAIDSVIDYLSSTSPGFDTELAMEGFAAFALLAGVALGVHHLARITRELQLHTRALASARGALADHIASQFSEWRLTPGEGEVALFALKGCDIAEIARLRKAAAGTVRAQLSQVYAKAGVSSQAMLVSLFIEHLLDHPADSLD